MIFFCNFFFFFFFKIAAVYDIPIVNSKPSVLSHPGKGKLIHSCQFLAPRSVGERQLDKLKSQPCSPSLAGQFPTPI